MPYEKDRSQFQAASLQWSQACKRHTTSWSQEVPSQQAPHSPPPQNLGKSQTLLKREKIGFSECFHSIPDLRVQSNVNLPSLQTPSGGRSCCRSRAREAQWIFTHMPRVTQEITHRSEINPVVLAPASGLYQLLHSLAYKSLFSTSEGQLATEWKVAVVQQPTATLHTGLGWGVENTQSAEETARGSRPAEWKQSSWKTASAPAKSRQVKNPRGGSLFLAFGRRAELTSATALAVSSRQQSRSPSLSTTAVNSGHDESNQVALAAWPQLLGTTADLSQPLSSNYRSWQAKMPSFNQSPKPIPEVAMNLKLYYWFQGLEVTDTYPGLDLFLIFIPGTERSFTTGTISVCRLSFPLV